MVAVPHFWSDQYDVKDPVPRRMAPVTWCTSSGRRAALSGLFQRDGVLSGVVGGGMPGKVMKTGPGGCAGSDRRVLG